MQQRNRIKRMSNGISTVWYTQLDCSVIVSNTCHFRHKCCIKYHCHTYSIITHCCLHLNAAIIACTGKSCMEPRGSFENHFEIVHSFVEEGFPAVSYEKIHKGYIMISLWWPWLQRDVGCLMPVQNQSQRYTGYHMAFLLDQESIQSNTKFNTNNFRVFCLNDF